MKILGIGTDLVELNRIDLALNRSGKGFVEELMNKNERANEGDRILSIPFLAGRLAAKEAVAKALGTGISGLHWHEIEIYNGPTGQPHVNLIGRANLIAMEKNIKTCLVSISHSEHFAIANSLTLIENGE
jgi:holo-[acyl-carrier protein] synthase